MADLASTIAVLRELREAKPLMLKRYREALDALLDGVEELERYSRDKGFEVSSLRYRYGCGPDQEGPDALERLAAAEAENKRLIAALEEAEKVIGPFASATIADGWDSFPDDTGIPSGEGLLLGDFRAARAWRDKHGAGR